MKYARLLAFATLVLSGCGVQHTQVNPNDADLFINQTTATQAQLWTLWQQAQTTIATQPVLLNAVDVDLYSATPVYAPADPKAYNITPNDQITVTEVEGNDFACAASPTGYCYGEVLGNTIQVASKWLLSSGVTGYEMQNVILRSLGYDISGR